MWITLCEAQARGRKCELGFFCFSHPIAVSTETLVPPHHLQASPPRKLQVEQHVGVAFSDEDIVDNSLPEDL